MTVSGGKPPQGFMQRIKRQGLNRSAGRALRHARLWLTAGLMLGSLPLAACSVSIADLPVVGLPEGTPARPKDPGSFPAVHDMPAAREQSALEPAEQAKIEGELAAARDRQAAAAAAANTADLPKPATAGKK